MERKLIKTIPKEISEATKAAIARAVPALSVSTTVRTPAGAVTAVFTPLGLVEDLPIPEGPVGPGLRAGVSPGSGGLAAAGKFAVAPAPAGLPAPPVGRGGREIRMVSFRKSEGGFATPGTAGAGAGSPPGAGTKGTDGFGMLGTPGKGGLGNAAVPGAVRPGGFGNPGTLGNEGFGGGTNLMVSFFKPGSGESPGFEGGGVGKGAIGGLMGGVLGGWGSLATAGRGGAPEEPGEFGGKGTPSGICR